MKTKNETTIAAKPRKQQTVITKGNYMQRVTPCLWFDNQAEEAVNFYVSVFENSQITHVARYGDAGAQGSGRPKGSVMTVAFRLDGQEFLALNGGPYFTFTPAVSFIVNCETQDQIDDLWERLSDGGETQQCGWLKDKYGVSWQVVPAALGQMMQDEDPEKSDRVMKALLQMTKIDIKGLKRAYEKE